MDPTKMIILSNGDYGSLCWVAGLGWGLFIATLVSAVIIDGIKWRKWANGQ